MEPSGNGSTRHRHGIVSPGDTLANPMLEAASCFRCGTSGAVVHDLDPFSLRRCGDCGQHFMNPRLSATGRRALYGTRSYFDEHVYRNGLANHLQRQWMAGRLDLIDEARHGRRGSMLEVGCGYGGFLAAARDRGWRPTGVELSEPGAAEARQRTGLDVRAGEIGDVDPSFDVICGWDVIEHVPDPGQWVETARLLLAEDGLLALSLPYFDSMPARVLGSRWGGLKPHKHIWHFTTDHARRLLADAGFGTVSIITSPLAAANRWRFDSMVVVAGR
jgi:SAM-dependent methyltransferase